MGEHLEQRKRQAAEAAMRAADPDRLLPGEDPATTYVDDAQHWVSVYAELLGVKAELITVAREARRDAHPAVAVELSGTDLPILERERDRFAYRLRFWRERAQQLASTDDPTPSTDEDA